MYNMSRIIIHFNRKHWDMRLITTVDPTTPYNPTLHTCCASPWVCVCRDDSWQSETSEVNAKPVVVVLEETTDDTGQTVMNSEHVSLGN